MVDIINVMMKLNWEKSKRISTLDIKALLNWKDQRTGKYILTFPLYFDLLILQDKCEWVEMQI
jgi:hypothetical protein